MPLAYDSSGTGTSSAFQVTVPSGSTITSAGRVFTGWAAPSAAYSSLTLNLSGSCSVTAPGDGGGSCAVEYSLNSGTSWTVTAFPGTVSLSPSQSLSALQVVGCITTTPADDGTSTTTKLTISDISTSGVISSVANTRTASETIALSPAVGLNRQVALSNTLTISPAAIAVYGGSRSTPEAVGITPTVSYIHNGKSVTSDPLSVVDASVRVAGLHFAVSESVGVSPSILVVFPRFASETVTLGDSLVIRQAPKRNFSESVSLSISGVGSAAGIRSLSESVSLTDTSIRQVGLSRGLSESGGFADTFTKLFGYRPGPIEVVNISGIVNLGYAGRPFVDVQVQPVIVVARTVRPLISESLALSPAVLATLPRFKLISELLGLNPTTLVSHAARRFTVESGAWRDVLSSTTLNVAPHAEKNTIGQSVGLSELLVVSVRSSAKKRAVIVMSL